MKHTKKPAVSSETRVRWVMLRTLAGVSDHSTEHSIEEDATTPMTQISSSVSADVQKGDNGDRLKRDGVRGNDSNEIDEAITTPGQRTPTRNDELAAVDVQGSVIRDVSRSQEMIANPPPGLSNSNAIQPNSEIRFKQSPNDIADPRLESLTMHHATTESSKSKGEKSGAARHSQ